ncbi:MAG: cell wall-binding repeat-containing protein [Coriobacteriia bacterium]
MTLLLAVSLALALLMVVVPVPAGAWMTGSGGALLTDDGVEQMVPDIGGASAAWQDFRNGNWDIYGADGDVFPICTATGTQDSPRVGDDVVVWRDSRTPSSDIYGWDAGTRTEFPICTNAAAQFSPDVHRRYVVWEDYRNGNADIYGYDLYLAEEFPVCVAAGGQYEPAVWGDTFVWRDTRTNAAGDIWLWDAGVGGQPMPINGIMNANVKIQIDICQEWVVWSEFVGGWEIKAFNLSSERVRTVYAGLGDQYRPRLSADWLVFVNAMSGNPDIELYDFMTNQYYDMWGDNDISTNPSIYRGAIVNQQTAGVDNEIAIGGPTWVHDTQQIWGSDRYQTAAAIAIATFPQGAPSVLIATGENFPDALGAAALAGHENIPILLTDGDSLSPSCANGIQELGVDDDVWIVGGESVISDAVVMQINNAIAADIDPPKRIAGADRYGTALAIANEISGGSGNLDEPYAFVATGLNYPDALAASSISYALDIPIYLVPGATIPQATIDQMVADGVEMPVILGGTGAVGAGVETALRSRFGDENVSRVWGPNRYQTAYEVSQFAKDVLDFGVNGACVATADSFPDALAGGQLAGVRYAPIVLTNGADLSLAAQDFCTGNEMDVRYITFLGGPGAIAQDVRDDINGWLH